MERKPNVMLCLKMWLMKIIILFCSTTGALAANVELGDVGDDPPNYLWCRCNSHKITPDSAFRVTFRGRSTNTSTEYGKIDIDPANKAYFGWILVSNRFLVDGPTLMFTPEMNILAYSTPRQLLVKPNTPDGLYYVKFIARDDSGAASERIQGCLVEVVKELPDVEVVDLKYDPPLPRISYNTIRMTIRNNAQYSSLLSVPWSISILKRTGGSGGYQVQVLDSGVINNLIPGHLYEVTAEDRFLDRGGVSLSDKIHGEVDKTNVIGENETERTNNWKEISRKSRPAPPRLVEQDLDYFKAQNNGAQFRDNIEDNIHPLCSKIGVGDWQDPNWSPAEGRKSGVLFQANCEASGGKANPEAFAGFRLKNGWKVKSVDDPDFVRRSQTVGPLRKTGFELNTKPEIGSDSPYIKAHIWADPASFISVGIRIVIEGPEGTDPYCGNCPSDCTLYDSICLKGLPPAGQRFRCNTHYDCAAGYACGDDHYCHQVCNP